MVIQCRDKCSKEDYIKKYKVVKSVSQSYRRTDKTTFRLPDNWHWCRHCSKFYQGPDFCPCCGGKTRITSRQKKTTEEQKNYLANTIEAKLKFKKNQPYAIKKDILKDLDKWNALLSPNPNQNANL